jgi:hypothetical protein
MQEQRGRADVARLAHALSQEAHISLDSDGRDAKDLIALLDHAGSLVTPRDWVSRVTSVPDMYTQLSLECAPPHTLSQHSPRTTMNAQSRAHMRGSIHCAQHTPSASPSLSPPVPHDRMRMRSAGWVRAQGAEAMRCLPG